MRGQLVAINQRQTQTELASKQLLQAARLSTSSTVSANAMINC